MNHRRIGFSPRIAASVRDSRLTALARLHGGELPRAAAPWYSIKAQADVAEIMIYDEIGYYGVTAGDFVRELRAVEADTIRLSLNSPGGDVFDGVAIYNALIEHDARIETHVDGLAASAASVIAMAGDEIVIAKSAELMIHDAWGFAVGNAADMRKLGDQLDRISGQMAEVYADRAGGTPDEWRAAMLAETWYTGEEAVTAGLADRVKGEKKSEATSGDSPSSKATTLIYNRGGRPDAEPAQQNTETPFTFDVAGLASALKGAF